MKIKDVKQLPADFRPANTSPQLSGPYPGRNATRGYLVGESDNDRLSEFTGDEMQYATTTAPAAADNPERQVGVLMFGRFGKTDPMARTAWAALQRELPQEYPNEDAAATKVAEIAKNGGAIVTEKSRPEAERLVKRFQAYRLKSRIVDDNIRETWNPLDDERREQRAMDQERRQFKRDELEFELRGEEERMRAYNAGTFYLRINGRIWRRNGEPVAFQGRQHAQRAGQTIKDRDPSRDVVITRHPTDKVTEAAKFASEDVLSSIKKQLGDYLQDVASAVKKDPDLLDKLSGNDNNIKPVKVITTDDGHQIKIHGNEDDGFRITVQNRDLPTRFSKLDHAVMATEMFCDRQRSRDYLEER